jgi:hypothetical protein
MHVCWLASEIENPNAVLKHCAGDVWLQHEVYVYPPTGLHDAQSEVAQT